MSGAVGELRGEIQHYPYRDIADHLETIDRYTTLAARQMHGERPARRAAADRRCIRRWRFSETTSRGEASATACPASSSRRMNAYYVFLKFAKLRELQSAQGVESGQLAAEGRHPERPS